MTGKRKKAGQEKWEKAGQGKRKKAGQRKRDRKKTNLRDLLRNLKVEKILSTAQLLYQNNLFKNSIAQLLWENREK